MDDLSLDLTLKVVKDSVENINANSTANSAASTGDFLPWIMSGLVLLFCVIGVYFFAKFKIRQKSFACNESTDCVCMHNNLKKSNLGKVAVAFISIFSAILIIFGIFKVNAFANSSTGPLVPDKTEIEAVLNDDGTLTIDTCNLTNVSNDGYSVKTSAVNLDSAVSGIAGIMDTNITIEGFDGTLYSGTPNQTFNPKNLKSLAKDEVTELSFDINFISSDVINDIIDKPLFQIHLIEESFHNVSFDMKNHAESQKPDDQFVSDGGKVVKPQPNPEDTGYTFLGWYSNSPDKLWDFDKDVVTEDIVLNACWQANSYTVHFDVNIEDEEYSGTMEDENFIYDQAQKLSKTNYICQGYTFLGWSTSKTGAVEFEDEQEVKNLTDKNNEVVNLYAIWQGKSGINYTVKHCRLDSKGMQSKERCEIEVFTGTSGEEVSPNLIDYEGYTAKQDKIKTKIKGDGSTVIEYEYTPNWTPYTVIHYRLSGVKLQENPETEVLYGYTDSVVIPTTKVYEGYDAPDPEEVTIIGDGSAVVEYDYNPRKDTKYVVNHYKMVGGSRPEEATESVEYKGITDTIVTAVVKRYDGYTSPDPTEITIDGKGETTVDYEYCPNSYKVEFYKWEEEAEEEMYDQAFVYDQTQNLTANTFEWAGHTFKGWKIKGEAGGAVYDDGQPVSNLTTENGGVIELVAVWETITYTVTFNGNGHGGSTIPSTQYRHFGETVEVPTADPTETGWGFGGWYKEKTCDTPWEFGKDVVKGNTILYAKWTENKYIVTFDMNGHSEGTPPSPTSREASYGQTILPPTEPKDTGYTFGGWYKDTDCTYPWDFGTDTVKEAKTLYAKWTAITYNITWDARGGTFDEDTGTPTYTIEEAIIKLPTNISKDDGHGLFLGWKAEPLTPGEQIAGWPTGLFNEDLLLEKPYGNVRLVAQWYEGKTKLITYNKDKESSGEPPKSVVVEAEKSVIIADNGTLKNGGKTFIGWNTKPDGLGDVYEAGQEYKDDKNLTLWPIWNDWQGLCFTGHETDSNIKYEVIGDISPKLFYYTASTGKWEQWNANVKITLGFSTVLIKGDNSSGLSKSDSKYIHFVIEGEVSSKGNINSLLLKDGFTTTQSVPCEYCFYKLFYNCKTLTSAPQMPMESEKATLKPYCYESMFENCIALTTNNDTPINLHAKNLPKHCYYAMFKNCSSITKVNSFYGNDASGYECCTYMMSGCSSLTSFPNLEAGYVGYCCYAYMFKDCTSLIKPPVIYGKTVKGSYPYYRMFYGCKLLYVTEGSTEYAKQNNIFSSVRYEFDPNEAYEIFEGTRGFTGNLTLYKSYYWNYSYTVDFDMQGKGEKTPQSQIIIKGQTVTKPTKPTHPQYVFVAWFTEPEFINEWNFSTDKVTKDMTLYAKWTPYFHDIIFDGNGHGGSTIPATITRYPEGITLTKPSPDPSEPGYIFDGWYKESSCTNPWDFSKDIVEKADRILYAKWTPIEYKVHFDGNGHGGSSIPSDIEGIYYGKTIPSQNKPEEPGYTFCGWFKEQECINEWDFDTDTITDNTTLYAKWTPIVYTITWDTDEGWDPQGGSETYTIEDRRIDLPKTPVKSECVYNGWKVQEGQEAINWPAEAFYDSPDLNHAYGNVTIKAQWGDGPEISVTYHSDDGCAGSAPETQTVNVGGKITIADNGTLAKEKHTLVGWTTKDEQQTFYYVGQVYTATENLDLYPVWQEYTGLTFTAESYDCSVAYAVEGTFIPKMYYRTTDDWQEWPSNTKIDLPKGSTMLVKGDNTQGLSWSTKNYVHFVIEGDISAGGNVNSLLDNKDGSSIKTIPNNYCYYALFNDCSTLLTAPQMPATTLTENCYRSMFKGCTNLNSNIKLPAKTLPNYCYYEMFCNCESLERVSQFSATSTGEESCRQMMYGCKNLISFPDLNSTKVEYAGYCSMFEECTSLKTAPRILETVQIGWYPFWRMFYNCKSLYVSTEQSDVKVIKYTWSDPIAQGMFAGTRGYTGDPVTDTSYYCHDSYVVSFDMNGHGSAIDDKYVVKDKKVTQPSTPSASGYKFVCWCVDKDCTTTWDFGSYTITEDTVLYAKWAKESNYIVSFNGNGATGGHLPSPLCGNGILTLPDNEILPEKDGYYFECWNTKDDGSGTNYSPSKTIDVSSNLTLYAKWTQIEPDYLSFTAKCGEESSVQIKYADAFDIEYSTDLETWTKCHSKDVFKFNGYRVIYFRGDNPNGFNYDAWFIINGEVSANGYVNSLLQKTGFKNLTTLPKDCYYYFFRNCGGLVKAPILNINTAGEYCCTGMFDGCSKLEDASKISINSSKHGSYMQMFSGCSSLVYAPKVEVNKLDEFCFHSMFYQCSSLYDASNIILNSQGKEQSASNSCCHMFEDCTKLTNVPTISLSGDIKDYISCCERMFSGCISIIDASRIQLKANTLYESCYDRMFGGCSNMVIPPQLSFKYIDGHGVLCCREMFINCNKLCITSVSTDTKYFKTPSNLGADDDANFRDMLQGTCSTAVIKPNTQYYYRPFQ